MSRNPGMMLTGRLQGNPENLGGDPLLIQQILQKKIPSPRLVTDQDAAHLIIQGSKQAAPQRYSFRAF